MTNTTWPDDGPPHAPVARPFVTAASLSLGALAVMIAISLLRAVGRMAMLLLPLLVVAGCATNFGRGPFLLAVDSTPQGATVVYDRGERGHTPCTIWVEGNNQDIVLRLKGHHDQHVVLGGMSNSSWVAFGFLFLGPIELLVDWANDSFQHVNYAPVSVQLVPVDQPVPPTWHRGSR